jgi:hypothetical protein
MKPLSGSGRRSFENFVVGDACPRYRILFRSTWRALQISEIIF